MEHPEIEEQLTAYLLDDLAPEQAEAMRLHLNECDDCRALAKELEPTLDLLRGALAVDLDVPERLDDERKQEIFAPRHVPATVIWLTEHRSGLMRVAGVAAIGMVLAALMLPAVQNASMSARQETEDLARVERQVDDEQAYPLPAPAPPPALLPPRAAAPAPAAAPAMRRGFAEEEAAPFLGDAPVVGKMFRNKEEDAESMASFDDGFGLTEEMLGEDPGGRYQVKKGDTLTAIAAANETTVRELAELNQLADADAIQAGGSLVIPERERAREHLGRAAQAPQPFAGPTGGTGIAETRRDMAAPAAKPARTEERFDVDADFGAFAVTDTDSARALGLELAGGTEGMAGRRPVAQRRGGAGAVERDKDGSGWAKGRRVDELYRDVSEPSPYTPIPMDEVAVTTAPEMPELVAFNRPHAGDGGVNEEASVTAPADSEEELGIEFEMLDPARASGEVELGKSLRGAAARPAVAPGQAASANEGTAMYRVPDSADASGPYARAGDEAKGDTTDEFMAYGKLDDFQAATMLDDRSAEPETELVARAYGVNPFVHTAEQPFSTFAIDVDTAAYTLMRKHVQHGVLPPAEAVRTEEFVNFFDYDYRAPERQTFAVYTALAPTPFGDGRLLNIGVKGKRLGREEQRPAVLTFVIDTSGSMDTPDRLGLVRTSLEWLIEELGETDQVALVQVDSQARLILPPTPITQRETISAALQGLQCSGSTHLEQGIQLGYEVAAQAFTGGAVNRVLLLSDGAANLGSDNADQILSLVEAHRKQGIFCSVFGFGIGAYNDEILEQLANKGDGTYRFIDSREEARRVFVDDLAATLHVIASDVKIQVEFFPQQVTMYRQLGYENRQLTQEQFRDDTVDAGEVGSGESVTALYELVPGADLDQPLGVVRVRYRDTATGEMEEVAHPIRRSDAVGSFEETAPRFRLAAAVAEFSEILRGSPFAEGSDYTAVAEVLRPVALERHLDQRVQELLQLVQRAPGLPRAGN